MVKINNLYGCQYFPVTVLVIIVLETLTGYIYNFCMGSG